ncbi:MAG: hypothetical protein JW931_02340 [Methanomicrobiaceae archaeon]|nr:hypothetical protein [Methanomicrobiaceae archaeon]
MKKNHKVAIVACLALSLLLFPVSVLLTAVGLIITGTLAMSVLISESAETVVDKPILFAYLGEDGRSFILKNIGNVDALDIHISLVPSNLEFLNKRIEADTEDKTECGQLIGKNRIIVDYTDETGNRYSKTANLNFKDDCEYDPTKPMIPIFK